MQLELETLVPGEIEIIEVADNGVIRRAAREHEGKLVKNSNEAMFLEFLPKINAGIDYYIGNSSYISAEIYESGKQEDDYTVKCVGKTPYPVERKSFQSIGNKYYNGQFSFTDNCKTFEQAIQLVLDWLNCRVDEGLPPEPAKVASKKEALDHIEKIKQRERLQKGRGGDNESKTG